MQKWDTRVGVPHLCDLLPFGDLVTFGNQNLPVMPVSTQVIFVMFDDDKPAVSDQSTTAVNNFARLRRLHGIACATCDLDSTAQRIGTIES